MTTTALPAILPVYQFFDNSGTPLVGGFINTYLTGTTTDTTTWADENKATANANPIALDAYGRATIFIDQAIVYRFDVKRSDLTLVRTMDPVRTPNSVGGSIDLSGAVLTGPIPLIFEGNTPNAFETSLAITDPTADRTVTIQDRSGTLACTADEYFTGTTSFDRVVLVGVDSDVIVTGAVGTTAGDGHVYSDWYMTRGHTVVNNNVAATYSCTDFAVANYIAFTGTQVATLGITLPAAASGLDGALWTMYTQAAVGTSITFTSSGATFVGAPTTLSAGQVVRFHYHHATLSWLPA